MIHENIFLTTSPYKERIGYKRKLQWIWSSITIKRKKKQKSKPRKGWQSASHKNSFNQRPAIRFFVDPPKYLSFPFNFNPFSSRYFSPCFPHQPLRARLLLNFHTRLCIPHYIKMEKMFSYHIYYTLKFLSIIF